MMAKRSSVGILLGLMPAIWLLFALNGCQRAGQTPRELSQNVRLELIDWHIAGLWAINSPVAWVRVTNYNAVRIKNITFEYSTFDETGDPMDVGTFTIEETVNPGDSRNFIELYLGLVSVHSESLRVRVLAVERA